MQSTIQLPANSNNHRLYSLDYLRGLAAFGIMLYHYLSWTMGDFSAESFMGRFGIYGVSIFYVLSGLTLHHVYYHKMKPSKGDIISFFKKRFFRIFPLLWLVTITAILLSRKVPNMLDLFLNLTGLFGFLKWDTYFSSGVWSIGNELVFYVFFPFFIWFTKRHKALMITVSVLLLGLYLYFAFIKLDPLQMMSEQWRDYVNPLNQSFLFLGGFLIGFFLHDIKVKNSLVIFLVLSAIAVFVFYPATGKTTILITGINRLVFTSCSFLICICFYKMTFQFSKIIHKPLTLLGEASYSVYLIHALVFGVFASKAFSEHIIPISKWAIFSLSIITSLIISYFVYTYFEKYFMKFGHDKKKTY